MFSVRMGAPGPHYIVTPRQIVSRDGTHKSLLLGNETVLATVPIEETDQERWVQARGFLQDYE